MQANDFEPEMYTEKEMQTVEKHIEKYYGKFKEVFHELVSPDIHVDICVIPPAKKRNYYILTTMGMGAHKMNVPEELKGENLERAELMIALPPDWKINDPDECNYWPIRLLKNVARLPVSANTWVGWGHTVDNQEPYAENTSLCGALLIDPEVGRPGGNVLTLPCGEDVNFYQIIPLYREEMDYKLTNGASALLEIMENIVSFVVEIDRPNASENYIEGELGFCALTMDDVKYHMESIDEKKLPVDRINAYNHLAAYLRWFIEHDMLSDMFRESFSEIINGVRENIGEPDKMPDLRLLLNGNALKGRIMLTYFDHEGAEFTEWYYGNGEETAHFYPCDVDGYAEKYFGADRYNSDEFSDEAYLFVPWNEDYYKGISKVIDEKYATWKAQRNSE